VRGGWSYFPALPELPPDIDSLGAAITLFARVAPQYLPLCREPLALALAGRAADGQLPTWIIAPADPPAAQAHMQAAVRRFWGTAPDLDAQTRLHASLALAPALATDDVAQQGLAQLLHQAQPEGDWLPTWYPQREELSILALPLLRRSTAGRAALARAIAATAARRWDWPQEAAQALWLLLQPEASQAATEAAEAALAVLQEHQSFDGSWVESAWIRMPIGRAQGTVTQVATWGCRTLATAFGLRALRACAQR
jgi:squalene-hopene/tetraprenyl-beta-curcumene cyclase